MRAETRKRSTNIHSFSMNNTCPPASRGLAQTGLSVTLVFLLKKYVFVTFHMRRCCLHPLIKELLTI